MKLESIPSFLFAVFVLYWSLPLMAVSHTFLWDMKARRKDMYMWSALMRAFFRVKVVKFGSQGLCKDRRPILYLCNHRSWADFFLDVYNTEGCSTLMSRWMVFWAFPMFMTSAIALKAVLLFKRGTILDKKKFNEWLDRKFAGSLLPGLLVYPEGHRSIKPTSLPLKRGMLHFAHSRGMPVQMVISRGKENVLCEKTMTAAWGATMVVGFSEPVESKGTEFEAWFLQVQAAWDKLWKEVYAADENSLPPLVQPDPPTYDYPLSMRIAQAAAVYLSVPVFWLVMWLSAKAILASTAWLGAIGQQVLFCGLTAWVSFSLMTAQLH